MPHLTRHLGYLFAFHKLLKSVTYSESALMHALKVLQTNQQYNLKIQDFQAISDKKMGKSTILTTFSPFSLPLTML